MPNVRRGGHSTANRQIAVANPTGDRPVAVGSLRSHRTCRNLETQGNVRSTVFAASWKRPCQRGSGRANARGSERPRGALRAVRRLLSLLRLSQENHAQQGDDSACKHDESHGHCVVFAGQANQRRSDGCQSELQCANDCRSASGMLLDLVGGQGCGVSEDKAQGSQCKEYQRQGRNQRGLTKCDDGQQPGAEDR